MKHWRRYIGRIVILWVVLAVYMNMKHVMDPGLYLMLGCGLTFVLLVVVSLRQWRWERHEARVRDWEEGQNADTQKWTEQPVTKEPAVDSEEKKEEKTWEAWGETFASYGELVDEAYRRNYSDHEYHHDWDAPTGSIDNPLEVGMEGCCTSLHYDGSRNCWILTDGLGNGWIR